MDTGPKEAENKFYIEYFLPIIDQAIVSINERFQQLDHHSNNFGFLYDVHKLKSIDDVELRKHCMDLQILLVIL